jgi:TPR repeat protein
VEEVALETLWRAANGGDAQAQYAYGLRLSLLGDHEAAADWLMRAAAQDHALALLCLGHAHRGGHGIELDEAAAQACYARALAAGAPDAARFLDTPPQD